MNASLIALIGIAAFVVGQWLVTRKHWAGFLVWAGSNLMVAVMCLAQANHPTACMFLVYFLANVYSMMAWTRLDPRAVLGNRIAGGTAKESPVLPRQ
jgi:hypothetical protein